MAAYGVGDKDLYSPTSPVSEGGDYPLPTRDETRDPFDTRNEDKTEEAQYCKNDDQTEEAHYFRLDAMERVEPRVRRDTVPCPQLCVGSKYDKVCPLKPSHWVGIGRSKKCQLLLDNHGVSRNHCDIRWDHHRRVVELRDNSNTGTLVNGQTIKKSRCILGHADHISIEGKNINYNFLLDMRPVDLGFSDPRDDLQTQQSLKKAYKAGPWQQRDSLRTQIINMEEATKNFETLAWQKEKEFYEIATARRLRGVEDKKQEDQYQRYLRGTEELEVKLKSTREEWLERLQMEYEKNEKDVNMIIEETKMLQEKVEKLQLKKDELERSIHPEKYAVADVSCSGSVEQLTASASEPQPHQEPMGAVKALAGDDSADGEEDAFSGNDAGFDKMASPVKPDHIPLKDFEQAAKGADIAEFSNKANVANDAMESDEMAAKRRKLGFG